MKKPAVGLSNVSSRAGRSCENAEYELRADGSENNGMRLDVDQCLHGVYKFR